MEELTSCRGLSLCFVSSCLSRSTRASSIPLTPNISMDMLDSSFWLLSAISETMLELFLSIVITRSNSILVILTVLHLYLRLSDLQIFN